MVGQRCVEVMRCFEYSLLVGHEMVAQIRPLAPFCGVVIAAHFRPNTAVFILCLRMRVLHTTAPSRRPVLGECPPSEICVCGCTCNRAVCRSRVLQLGPWWIGTSHLAPPIAGIVVALGASIDVALSMTLSQPIEWTGGPSSQQWRWGLE